MKLDPSEAIVNDGHCADLMLFFLFALERPRSEEVDVDTFPWSVDGCGWRKKTILFVGIFLFLTNGARCNVMFNKFLEAMSIEMHAYCTQCT